MLSPSGARLNSARRVALVTGSAAGLGWSIAREFLASNYDVFLVSRSEENLRAATDRLRSFQEGDGQVHYHTGDVTDAASVSSVIDDCRQRYGRLDVLVNCVGTSDRGLVEELSAERIDEMMRVNVHSALLCSQAALPLLRQSQGAIVNIGSLASKIGARYLGGYAIAKHALAGMTQQLRLELMPSNVHVALVCPGPIRRNDRGERYQERMSVSLPSSAAAPGAGAKLKGLDPAVVAKAVRRCAEQRLPEIILPRRARLLIAISNTLPRIGDELILKFTSSK